MVGSMIHERCVAMNVDYISLFVDRLNKRNPVLEPFLFHQPSTIEFMEKTRSFWPDAHRDPELMAKLAMAPVKYSCFNVYVVPFGITYEAEAFGAYVKYGSKTAPPTVIKPVDDVSKIKIPNDPLTSPLDIVAKATKIIKENDNTRPVIESMSGPFTAIAQALGIPKTIRYLMSNDDELNTILDEATKFLVELYNSLIEFGGDIIVILEPVSSLIGPKRFEKLSKPYIKKLINKVKVPVILHICGNATPLLENVLQISPNAFSFDHNTNLKEAVNILKGKVLLVGNIDPVNVLWRGTKEEIYEKTKKALEEGIDIPAPGCGLAIETPIRNLDIFCKAVNDYRKEKG